MNTSSDSDGLNLTFETRHSHLHISVMIIFSEHNNSNNKRLIKKKLPRFKAPLYSMELRVNWINRGTICSGNYDLIVSQLLEVRSWNVSSLMASFTSFEF